MISKRSAIKKILETKIPVYNSGVLEKDAKQKPPFLILEMTGERQAMKKHLITFSVFIYAPLKAVTMVDLIEKEVIRLLHKKRIECDEGAFYVEGAKGGADFVNEKIGAVGKEIEFTIPYI